MPASSGYKPIRAHDDDAEADAAEESTRFIPSSSSSDTAVAEPKPGRATVEDRRPRWKKNWRLATILLALLGATNLLSLAAGAFAGRRAAYARHRLDRKCAAHTTHYSPLLKDVAVEYGDVRFNGSFLEETVYRRPGSPEVDAAWEALGVDYRAGVIPAAEGPASGLTPGHVQRAARYGGGFFVNVEGMHHLHCLNLVRKALYYNYPYYRDLGTHAFMNDAPILQRHVSHCVDILRQVLMCNVDTGVLGQVWYDPDAPAAFPDFHTTHTCKNYDAVRRWAEQLQAPPVDQLPPDYLEPARPDAIWPSTP